MGRKREWCEDMRARFASGTFQRIDSVMRPKQARTDYVRQAVESALERDESRANIKQSQRKAANRG